MMLLILYFRREKRADAFNSYDSNAYCSMLRLHSLLRNRSERRQPDLVDKVPGLQPLLRPQLKLLVVEKTIVEAPLDALVVQVLPDEHQFLASVPPRPRLPLSLGQCLQNLWLTWRPLPKVSQLTEPWSVRFDPHDIASLLQSPREEVGSGNPDKTFAPHQAAHTLGADLLPLSCLHPIASCLRAASRTLTDEEVVEEVVVKPLRVERPPGA